MKLKQRIVRTMMDGLPYEEQVLMVTDFLAWVFSDFTSTQREKKLAFWIPKLIEDISAGRYGLWLLIYHYMKYLMSLRWLRNWFNLTKASWKDHTSR